MLKIKLTTLAATPPAPAAPISKYLTLATVITALTICVVNIRSPFIFLLMRILVTPGYIPYGVLTNVLICRCLSVNKVWIWHFWWLTWDPGNWGKQKVCLEISLPAFSMALFLKHCSQCKLKCKHMFTVCHTSMISAESTTYTMRVHSQMSWKSLLYFYLINF